MSISIESCLALLPQTQCQECGYQGCQPYASALVSGAEDSIARCLPGGQPVADALAALLNKPPQKAKPLPTPSTAMINLGECIGCSLCIKACPVDAIWGAQGFEHYVFEQDCTGCQLCLPACPTACITMEERVLPLPSADNNLKNIAAKKERQEQARKRKWEQHRHALTKK